LRIGWIPTDKNIADMLTKVQPGTKRGELREMVMFKGDYDKELERKINAMNVHFAVVR